MDTRRAILSYAVPGVKCFRIRIIRSGTQTPKPCFWAQVLAALASMCPVWFSQDGDPGCLSRPKVLVGDVLEAGIGIEEGAELAKGVGVI